MKTPTRYRVMTGTIEPIFLASYERRYWAEKFRLKYEVENGIACYLEPYTE